MRSKDACGSKSFRQTQKAITNSQESLRFCWLFVEVESARSQQNAKAPGSGLSEGWQITKCSRSFFQMANIPAVTLGKIACRATLEIYTSVESVDLDLGIFPAGYPAKLGTFPSLEYFHLEVFSAGDPALNHNAAVDHNDQYFEDQACDYSPVSD